MDDVHCPYCGSPMTVSRSFLDYMDGNYHKPEYLFFYACINPLCRATGPVAHDPDSLLTLTRKPEKALYLLDFSELFIYDSFWLETLHAGDVGWLWSDRMATTEKELLEWKRETGHHYAGVRFQSGQCRSLGLYRVQWRAWNRYPTKEQRGNTPWESREQRDKALARDNLWITLRKE